MQSNEIWKEIPYAKSYEVSNFGNLRSTPRKVRSSVHKCGYRMTTPKNLIPWDNGKGYKVLGTQFAMKKKNYYVHRLVAELFIPNPKAFKEVNHIDGDKANNHFLNLEWCDKNHNAKHASDNDLVSFGEEHQNAKLTELQVIEILEAHKLDPQINRCELAKIYRVRDTAICRIISGKRWRRTWNKFHEAHPKEAIERGWSESRLAKHEPHKI